jgi:hypothetical protein
MALITIFYNSLQVGAKFGVRIGGLGSKNGLSKIQNVIQIVPVRFSNGLNHLG